jgi:YidC/Oxa1 family membrane protein insertase
VLISSITAIAQPFFELFGWLIAAFYQVVPNYAFAIALLTIVVMVVVFPVTRRATRSQMKIQLLAPQLKRLYARHKVTPTTPLVERRKQIAQRNTELLALYREHNVSATGGLLPYLALLPIFGLLYGTIRGLIHTAIIHGRVIAEPLYVPMSSHLYAQVVAHPGHLGGLGINLADSFLTSGLSFGSRLPFVGLVALAVGLQYLQLYQLHRHNPGTTGAHRDIQLVQWVIPIVLGGVYIAVPAALTIYFIVSALFRLAQQEFLYRRDPQIRQTFATLRTGANPSTG